MVNIRVHGDNIHTDNHQREVIGVQNINWSHMCVIYIVTHAFTSKLHQKKTVIYQKKSVFIRKNHSLQYRIPGGDPNALVLDRNLHKYNGL